MVIWAGRDGHFNKSESDGEAIQLICLKGDEELFDKANDRLRHQFMARARRQRGR
jgi:hypothetical protein